MTYTSADNSAESDFLTIAIIDNGFATSHEIFEGLLWKNLEEIPNNGQDDDNNGYIDDRAGWDISDGDNNVNPPSARLLTFNHGTHIAGIVAAAVKHRLGKLSSYPVRLMLIKAIADNAKNFHFEDGFRAMRYAIDNGADVINASWDGIQLPEHAKPILDLARRKGVFIVSTVGNYPSATATYPASHPAVFGVAGVNPDLTKATLSNYGDEVDLTAPSTNIRSADVKADSAYIKRSGTSMSAPQIAATVVLMKLANLQATVHDIEYCLKLTATPLDDVNLRFAGQLGAGQLNADAAIECIKTLDYSDLTDSQRQQPEGILRLDYKNQLAGEKEWLLTPRGEYNGIQFDSYVTGEPDQATLSLSAISNNGGDATPASIWSGLLSDLPDRIVTDHNMVRVKLRPEQNNSPFLFNSRYATRNITFSKRYCKGKTTVTSEKIISDGSGERPYALESDCKWLLVPPPGKNIKIIFDHLDLTAHTDLILLFRGDNTRQDTQLMQISGQELPPQIVVKKDPVLVWFVSADGTPGQGFRFSVSFVD